MEEVVVTGMGIVSSIGTTTEEFQRRMFAGDSGVGPIRGDLVANNFPVPYAARVSRSELSLPTSLSHLDPLRFAAQATEEAIRNLPGEHPIDAIVYGTAEGIHFDLIRESFRRFDPESFNWADTRSETTIEFLSRILQSRDHGLVSKARRIGINGACASGNQAIGLAFQRIRVGQWTRAIVGGVDARCNDHNLMNFYMLGALTTAEVPAKEASRPFSKDRSGFVRGEGAATLLLESRSLAEKRGATILGVVRGYGNTSDAYRLTDGRPDGSSAITAMRAAIADAGLTEEDIDAISAHGTSTPMNDSIETKAIKSVFGQRAYKIPVTSLKSQVGHSTVAAGALEAVSCLMMLNEQRLAPTINYKEQDPDCDLDYVPNEARSASLSTILSNNFGFGGQNASLIFGRVNR